MKLLILHRIPYYKIAYHRGINHHAHEVTYIGTKDSLADIPSDLLCEKVVRPGKKAVDLEVIDWINTSQQRFDRIISLSEYELLAAAKIRTEFGIQGASLTSVNKVRDKVLMKQCIQQHNLRVPQFHPLSTLMSNPFLIHTWSGKTVLKPIDGASSENIKIFTSLEETYRKVSERKTGISVLDHEAFSLDSFEVEEYIEGTILHIDGLVKEGKLILCIASEYLGTCLDYANGYPLGSFQIETSSEMKQWTQQCVQAVDIQQGCFHLEAISTSKGLVFLEIANRVGGADVVKTFEMATGIHLPSAELSLITNEMTQPQSKKNSDKYGWFVFPGHHIASGYCHISLPQWLNYHASVIELFQLDSQTACKPHITYQPHEVPVAGVLKAGDSRDLKKLMQDIFQQVTIVEWKKSA